MNSINSSVAAKPTLEAEAHDFLIDFYREDVAKLSQLLNRDLSHWLQK